MNRRDFLRNAALIAAGVVAADQLELLDRLAPRRQYWSGADFGKGDAYEAIFTDYWRLDFANPRNQAVLTGFSAETRARVPEVFPDRRPIVGRRLIVPVLTNRGFDELTYERVVEPISARRHV